MDGIVVPPGEIYSFTEGGNGELGFYIVSNGTGQPWKCRVRPPCFAHTAVLNKILPGLFIADIVPTFGMINMIGGECDR
jgi:NADH-quinone oxidoreductase subunit D